MRSGNSTTSIWMRKWAAIPRGAHGDKRGRVVSFLSRAESLSQRRSRDPAPAVSRLRRVNCGSIVVRYVELSVSSKKKKKKTQGKERKFGLSVFGGAVFSRGAQKP